jgi:CheY-like chemotaxis protein
MKRILVIDDEPDVLEMIRAMLITKGHQVQTASSGEEGLAEAERNPPDLIITDLMMPRVSGLEVLKRVKKSEKLKGIPLVVVSALGDEKRPAEFWIKSLGIDDYIIKPFDPLDFIGRIEYLFRKGGYVSTQQPEFEMMPSPQRRAPVNADASETLIPLELSGASPSEVVRAFIEAWNRQEFSTEFDCLGEEMIGALPMRDYVSRRRAAFLDEKGQSRTQKVLAVEEEKISLNVAKVVIHRLDTTNGQQRERREAYSLKKTYKGWKIIACRMLK